MIQKLDSPRRLKFDVRQQDLAIKDQPRQKTLTIWVSTFTLGFLSIIIAGFYIARYNSALNMQSVYSEFYSKAQKQQNSEDINVYDYSCLAPVRELYPVIENIRAATFKKTDAPVDLRQPLSMNGSRWL